MINATRTTSPHSSFLRSPLSHLSDIPAGVAGATGTLGGMSEPPQSVKPPRANREVEMTLPSENRSLFD